MDPAHLRAVIPFVDGHADDWIETGSQAGRQLDPS
jgi:hypothetical protein